MTIYKYCGLYLFIENLQKKNKPNMHEFPI